MYRDPLLFIDGDWIAEGDAGSAPVLNPATGAEIARVPLAGPNQLDRAAAAAARAFPAWSRTPPIERAAIIQRATALLRERAPEIARIMTLEQGKPLAESTREVQLSADIIDFLAEEGKRAYGRLVPPRSRSILAQAVLKVPVGPVAAFTPWNFPVNLPSRKIGGALAAGCTMVLKAAEETPGSAVEIVRAFADAGLPAGVLNLVFGVPAEVSERLLASPLIRKVSFTGSVEVGKLLGELAARGMKRYTPELGGHAPVLVLDDADPAAVARVAVQGKYRNAGQVCASPTRFLVAESIHGDFVEAFVAETRKLKVGNGLEPGVFMGPVAHARRLDAMARLTEDATRRGAVCATGGTRRGNEGFFFAPTVLTEVPLDCEAMTREPFGPLALIRPVGSVDEAVGIANALPYGLAAYLFTADLERAAEIGERIEAGMVGINHFGISQPETPFGGVKESGIGSESGAEGLLGYMDTKLVSTGVPVRTARS
jgi:succinate-semialdehyde dehydrogenase/glutarate-semialdehyde dehydrogenase